MRGATAEEGGGQPDIILLEGSCTGTDPAIPTWVFHFFAPHSDQGTEGSLTVSYKIDNVDQPQIVVDEAADHNTKSDWFVPIPLNGTVLITGAISDTLTWSGAGESGNPISPDACRKVFLEKLTATETHPVATFAGVIEAIHTGEDHGNQPPGTGDDVGETPTFTLPLEENALASTRAFAWVTTVGQTVTEGTVSGWTLDGYAIVADDASATCTGASFALDTNIVAAGSESYLICIKNTYVGDEEEEDEDDGGRPAVVIGSGTCVPDAASPIWVFHPFAPPPAEEGVGSLSVTYTVDGGEAQTVLVPEADDMNNYPDWYLSLPLDGALQITAATVGDISWNGGAGGENALVTPDSCRSIRVQKVTDSLTHPAATFTGTIVAPEEDDEGGPGKPDDPSQKPPGAGGDEEADVAFSLDLAVDASTSEIDHVWATKAQQTVTELPPAIGWTLGGYALIDDPDGTATCDGATFSSTNVIAPSTTPQLVCILNSFAQAPGTLTILTDDDADPGDGTPGVPVGGATFLLELIVDGVPVETICVTDDSTADTSSSVAVACTGLDPHNADDEDDAPGITTLSNLALGTWVVTEVGFPENHEDDSCTGDWHATRGFTLDEANPVGSIGGAGCSSGSAFHNRPHSSDGEHGGGCGGDEGDEDTGCGHEGGGQGPKQVTIFAYAAVCDSFASVPRNPDYDLVFDYDGDLAAGPLDTTEPVQAGTPLPAGCRLAAGTASGEGFSFNFNVDEPMVTHPNPLPMGGLDFGAPVNSSGWTSVSLPRHDFTGQREVWVSEVPLPQFGFAGLRCYDDIQYQDNSEFIHLAGGKGEPHEGSDFPKQQDVYCIAYNVGYGSLSVIKHDDVDDAHGGNTGAWEFSISGPAGFVPKVVSVPRSSGSDPIVLPLTRVPAGTYTISETNGNGAACSAQDTKTFQTGFGSPGAIATSGTATVATGGTVTVDIFNSDCGATLGAGNLRVFKVADTTLNGVQTVAPRQIEGWEITVDCPGAPIAHQQTRLAIDGKISADFLGLPNNVTCTVSEQSRSGYITKGWQLTDTTGPATASGNGSTTSIHMDDSDQNTVTFFNTEALTWTPPVVVVDEPTVTPTTTPTIPVATPTAQPATPTPPSETPTVPTATPGTETPTGDGTQIVLGEKTPGPPSTGNGFTGNGSGDSRFLLVAAGILLSSALALTASAWSRRR
ncbi:MAG: hypothetical protein AB7J35_14085 [Dehalococcoidia bacterium]